MATIIIAALPIALFNAIFYKRIALSTILMVDVGILAVTAIAGVPT